MKPKLTVPIMDPATTHTNLPPPPSPSFSALPTEILLLIVEQLHLDAKGLEDQPDESLSTWEASEERKAMADAVTALAVLCRTCRRLNEIVKPFLYEEPFLLQENGFDRGIRAFYGLVRVLGEENGLAELVRVYEDPETDIQDSLRAFLDRCDLERFPLSMSAEEMQSYQTLFILLNKYTPFFSKVAHNESLLDLDESSVLADLIPAVIICHCRNIRQLDHLTIGDRWRNRGRFLWRDMVVKSVTLPNLEDANLEGTAYSGGPWPGFAAFLRSLTPIDEAVFFVNRAPNLRRLTLRSFSSSDRPSVPVFPLENLATLDLRYCAFLREADLVNIISACPRLERFVFTSEASPTVRRARPFDFAFLGPALVLKALGPLSQQLKALSIEYAPMLDFIFMNEPNDTDTDDDMDTDDNMDADENLITHLGDFPNLKILRICHSALRWTHSDGPVKEQLVRLLKGCPRLESLDITHVDIREAQIRPQLEGLAAVASMSMPLLKGLRVAILKKQGRDEPEQWTRDDSCPHLSDLFAKDHLATYQKTGIKLLIDIESLWQEVALLQTFSVVHEGVRDTVTVHPYLQDIMRAAEESG